MHTNQLLLPLSGHAIIASAGCKPPSSSCRIGKCALRSERYVFFFAELPVPVLGDLSEVTLLAQRLHRGSNPAKLNLTYSDICNLDAIEVNLVPEKKGIFLKHVEYQVTSKVLPTSTISSSHRCEMMTYNAVIEIAITLTATLSAKLIAANKRYYDIHA